MVTAVQTISLIPRLSPLAVLWMFLPVVLDGCQLTIQWLSHWLISTWESLKGRTRLWILTDPCDRWNMFTLKPAAGTAGGCCDIRLCTPWVHCICDDLIIHIVSELAVYLIVYIYYHEIDLVSGSGVRSQKSYCGKIKDQDLGISPWVYGTDVLLVVRDLDLILAKTLGTSIRLPSAWKVADSVCAHWYCSLRFSMTQHTTTLKQWKLPIELFYLILLLYKALIVSIIYNNP